MTICSLRPFAGFRFPGDGQVACIESLKHGKRKGYRIWLKQQAARVGEWRALDTGADPPEEIWRDYNQRPCIE
jgi:hypothetical protein